MDVTKRTPIDMTSWGHGPWEEEPHEVKWTDEDSGLRCLARRNRTMGMWCGYVAVGKDHPAYGKHYDQITADVHGGLTYADDGKIDGMDGLWVIGFDCGHGYDVMPGYSVLIAPIEGAEYRTVDYVTKECRKLAKQLAEMKEGM